MFASSGFIYRTRSGQFQVNWRLISPESFLATSSLVRELGAVRTRLSGRLLDIGCGTGPYRVMFADQVSEHIGVDIPHSYHSGLAVRAYANALALPFAAESFDSVLCTEVLEHTPNPFAAMSEISRVLRPGGAAIISTPFMYRVHEAPYDFFRYTPFSYEVLAKESGLEILSISPRGGYFTVLVDYLIKGLALAVSAVNAVVGHRQGKGHLLNRLSVRWFFYLLQLPLTKLLKNENVKSDVYTLGYVVVARKPKL